MFAPTLLFCLMMQFLGLYVASFLLIAGFMRLVGKIALWKSLLTAFTPIMFVTFDIVFTSSCRKSSSKQPSAIRRTRDGSSRSLDS
ncbi:hypothetical protein ABIC10_007764 [Bradyrhizobium sp. S3.2.12]